MKLHRSLVLAVINTLRQIFEEGLYADKAVELVLKQNPKWGSRDRRFIAASIYELVRWWRYYTEAASLNSVSTLKEYYTVFAVHLLLNEQDLPLWQEFNGIDAADILQKAIEIKNIRKCREAIPDWLDELAVSELGDAIWTTELTALNQEAKVVLRVNELKTSRLQLQRLLAEQQVETSIMDDYPQALILQKRQHLHQLVEYKQGLFEIQDASSQLVADFLQVEAGMKVIDACAGAGGKSLHLAANMKNTGTLLSLDVEERKLQELKKRAERAGISIIKTQLINPEVVTKLDGTADRLLVDVPCSGLGVLRRNPDTKWKLSPVFLAEIQQTQQKILQQYSLMVKKGGCMVYATCSILPSENEKQVATFLSVNTAFEFVEDKKIMPSDGFDGFYMAKLKRIK